jgi:hypothetical protein
MHCEEALSNTFGELNEDTNLHRHKSKSFLAGQQHLICLFVLWLKAWRVATTWVFKGLNGQFYRNFVLGI